MNQYNMNLINIKVQKNMQYLDGLDGQDRK